MREIRVADAGVPDEQRTIETELARVEAELDRLIGAIAAGGQLDRLLDAVRAREARRADLRRRLGALAGHRPAGALDDARHARLTDWRGLLTRQVPEARQVLTTLLDGRMIFTPREDAKRFYEFRGQGVLGRLLAGLVLPKGMVAPMGFEPVFQP